MTADPRDQFGPAASRYLTSDVHSDAESLRALAVLLGPGLGRVLDLATGAGHVAYAVAPEAAEVVALDLTPEMLEVTQAEALRRGFAHVLTQLGDAQALPFPDGHFNVVTCRLAPHHFPDVPRFLAEAHRVLTPGGRLLVVDTVGSEDPEADEALDAIERARDPSHVRDLPVSTWARLLDGAGFKTLLSETRLKRIGLTEWLERMSVPAETQEKVREAIQGATGTLRDLLRPEPDTFHLPELTVLAERLPGPVVRP